MLTYGEKVFGTIALNQELKAMDGRIIQCGRIDNQWVFKRLRDDRPHANGRGTVECTFYFNQRFSFNRNLIVTVFFNLIAAKLKVLKDPINRKELVDYLSLPITVIKNLEINNNKG